MLTQTPIVNSGSLIKLPSGTVGIIIDHIVDQIVPAGNNHGVVYIALVDGSRCRLIRESFEMVAPPIALLFLFRLPLQKRR